MRVKIGGVNRNRNRKRGVLPWVRMYLTVGLLQAHTYHTTIPPYHHVILTYFTLMRINEFPAILSPSVIQPPSHSFIHSQACRGHDSGSRISMLILTSVTTLSLIAAVS